MNRIAEHGRRLLAIFPNATEQDPVKLCKKLRHFEAEGQAIGVRLCNGPEWIDKYGHADPAGADRECTLVLRKVYKLLTGSFLAGHDGRSVPIFLNRDPRGYALKIRDDWMRANNVQLERDWGGYGIIAPEITGD